MRGTVGRPRGPSDPGPSARKIWLTLRALGPGAESPGTSGRPRGPSYPSTSHLEGLVDLSGHRTRARVTRDSWSTPRAFAPGPESPWTTVRYRGPLDKSASHQACWSTPRALAPDRVMPGSVGRPRRPSDPFPCRPGHLVEPAESGTGARVARVSWSPSQAFRNIPKWPGTAGRDRGPLDRDRVAREC